MNRGSIALPVIEAMLKWMLLWPQQLLCRLLLVDVLPLRIVLLQRLPPRLLLRLLWLWWLRVLLPLLLRPLLLLLKTGWRLRVAVIQIRRVGSIAGLCGLVKRL